MSTTCPKCKNHGTRIRQIHPVLGKVYAHSCRVCGHRIQIRGYSEVLDAMDKLTPQHSFYNINDVNGINDMVRT